mgnify:FL=1
MPTTKYKIKDKAVPSVSTIISRFKDSGAITGWSNKLGLSGVKYWEEMKRVQDIGTTFHDHAECIINKKEFTLSEDPEVQSSFNKFMKWWKKFNA